eukprot:SAG31_NODE_3654_length_4021_cov_2.291688_3_plen_212_part_00
MQGLVIDIAVPRRVLTMEAALLCRKLEEIDEAIDAVLAVRTSLSASRVASVARDVQAWQYRRRVPLPRCADRTSAPAIYHTTYSDALTLAVLSRRLNGVGGSDSQECAEALAALRRCSLFATLGPILLAALASEAVVESYEPGFMLVHEGDCPLRAAVEQVDEEPHAEGEDTLHLPLFVLISGTVVVSIDLYECYHCTKSSRMEQYAAKSI